MSRQSFMSMKTVPPQRGMRDGPGEAARYAAPTLNTGNLRLAVALPEGEDLNEWIAANSLSHVLAF